MTPAAENGTFTPTLENEAVTFSLEGVNKTLLWYSDRQGRDAGKAEVGQFISARDAY